MDVNRYNKAQAVWSSIPTTEWRNYAIVGILA